MATQEYSEEKLEEDLDAVYDLLENERIEDALESLRFMAGVYPDQLNVLFFLGEAAIEHSHNPNLTEEMRIEIIDEAISAFKSILSKDSHSRRIHLELARAYALKGEESSAIKHFKKVLGHKPPKNYPEAFLDENLEIIYYLLEQGRLEDALESLRAMPDTYSNHPDVLYLLGVSATEQSYNPNLTQEVRVGLIDEAISAFKTILSKHPGSRRIQLELVRTYVLKGEYHLAKEYFEEVLKHEPPKESLEVYLKENLEIIHYFVKKGYLEYALTTLRAMVDTYPDHPDILLLLGTILTEYSYNPGLEENEREEAIDEAVFIFEDMLTKEPDAHKIHRELARTYALKGEDSLAKEHFRKTLRDEPPSKVEKKIDYFLSKIKAQKPWDLTITVRMIYNDNINKATKQDTVFGSPFRDFDEEEIESGIGAIIEVNGEYQQKLMKNRLYWRVGGKSKWHDYEDSNNDNHIITEGYTGPRWLMNKKNEMSLLAFFRPKNIRYNSSSEGSELRLETIHRQDFIPGLVFNTQISIFDGKSYQESKKEGKRYKGKISFKVTPSVRAKMQLKRKYINPDTRDKNKFTQSIEMGVTVNLPFGGGIIWDLSREESRIKYKVGTDVQDGSHRRDKVHTWRWSLRHKKFNVLGFRPKLYGERTKQTSNAQFVDYTQTLIGLNFSYKF